MSSTTTHNHNVRALADFHGVSQSHLKVFSDTYPPLFRMAPRNDCASYICDLITGSIDVDFGLQRFLGVPTAPKSLTQLNAYVHTDDMPKVNAIVVAIADLCFKKGVDADDELCLTYRMKVKGIYKFVNRKSGLVISTDGKLMNWSVVHAMSALKLSPNVVFEWQGAYFSKSDILASQKLTSKIVFTSREFNILKLLREGNSTKQIAAKHFRSPKTVQTQISKMYLKTGSHSRAQLLSNCKDLRLL